jgi:hypothetical protein
MNPGVILNIEGTTLAVWAIISCGLSVFPRQHLGVVTFKRVPFPFRLIAFFRFLGILNAIGALCWLIGDLRQIWSPP